MQKSRIKCGIPGGIKFSSQVGKMGSHHLRRDPTIPTRDPRWDCQDPAYIPPDILPGILAEKSQLPHGISNRTCAAHSFDFSPNCTPLSSITIIYYTHFEITVGPCNLIGSNWCDLFLTRTIFCFNSHLFPSQWGDLSKNKTINQISRFTENNRLNCRKMRDNEYHEANFATFVSKTLIFSPQKWMNLISN